MFEYFYNEILRKTIVSFGSLFNEIKIAKVDDSNNVKSIIKVPLAYGPMQKFLARLEQSPDLNKPVQLTLPRMSFEMTGISYDSSRKVTTAQTFLSQSKSDGKDIRKMYMPVPYNVTFELSIYTKINDDMLQIIEQILPYFQPQYTITVDLVDQIGETRDVPVILDNISMSDEYEGDFTKRRALIYTLSFTAKTYIFGPTSSSVSQDIIKKVSIGLVSGEKSLQRKREVSYVVTPTATKSYSENNTTTLVENVSISDNRLLVDNSNEIPTGSFITINDETLKVISKDSNTLKVTRGYYGTVPSDHVSGSGVKLITESDNNLIEVNDDFGFDGDFV
jgi:hypothetical protein